MKNIRNNAKRNDNVTSGTPAPAPKTDGDDAGADGQSNEGGAADSEGDKSAPTDANLGGDTAEATLVADATVIVEGEAVLVPLEDAVVTVTTDAPAGDAAAPVADTVVPAEGDKPEGTEVAVVEPVKDIFADLPHITLGEAVDVLDTSGLETSDPRKYDKVHQDAIGSKLPVQRGWKHTTAMFVPGHNKGPDGGFKQGSVYGTIQQIVQQAGKAGITAYEVATEVRKRQIGNKRSHYCTKLPPVGWAEGWINTAITKGIINVHATKKAPALTVPEAAKDSEATPEQNAAAIAKAA